MTVTEQRQFDRWRQSVRTQQQFRTGQMMGNGIGASASNLGVSLNAPPKPVVFQVATGPSPIQMLLAGAALVAAGVIFTRNNT